MSVWMVPYQSWNCGARCIHRTEVEAYCAVVSAFRAQGELTWKKAQLLQDLRQVLRVPEERHKMELKRVTDDETLAELAKLSAG